MNFDSFHFQPLPISVHVGRGAFDKLPSLLEEYEKVFLISSPRLKKELRTLQGSLGRERMYHFDEVIQHVPEFLVEKALAALKQSSADVLLALGGGSSIGLAKALALSSSLPIVAVPTTYSGSEMTNIWGISSPKGKTTGRDSLVVPKHVIYDPDLTQTLPPSIAATSAMNAMAHLMEAVYAHDSNPITYQQALLGIENLISGLNLFVDKGGLSPEANERMLMGAFLGGKVLGEVSMALHHKAAHVLGGSFGLEHSQVHTILQAFVLEYQWEGLGEAIRKDFCKVFDHSYPPEVLLEMVGKLKVPTSLKEIGFQEKDIPTAARILLEKPYPNPVDLELDRLKDMLYKAWRGKLDGWEKAH